MRTILIILFFNCMFLNILGQSLKDKQKKYERVKTAYSEKEKSLKEALLLKKIQFDNIRVLLRIFKKEKQLEVWVKSKNQEKYELFKTYDICTTSGELGPKRKEGDMQMPEGFYYINHFNPVSNFYLSLGVDYPNQSDRILGVKNNLGGAIYIHGSCCTIGCTPITDDKIKELYILTLEAKNNGQNLIPVHAYPCKLDDVSFKDLESEYNENIQLIEFWKNLQIVYNYFEKNKKQPNISVDKKGKYLIN